MGNKQGSQRAKRGGGGGGAQGGGGGGQYANTFVATPVQLPEGAAAPPVAKVSVPL